MGAFDVLVDWLIERGYDEVPGPASAEALERLRAAGAPDVSIALATRLGSDLPGVMPPLPGAFEVPVLFRPDEVLEGKQVLRESGGKAMSSWWPIGGPDFPESWVVDRAGTCRIVRQGKLTREAKVPIEALFQAHLEALQAGEWLWNPRRRAWVAAARLPDTHTLVEALAGVGDAASLLATITAFVRSRLEADQEADLGGFGRFSVSRRALRTPAASALRIPVFRPGPSLKANLNGAAPPQMAQPGIDGLDADTARKAMTALVEGVGAKLRADGVVGWPGLGELSAPARRSITGEPRRFAEFRAWPELKRALNPE
ncbi:MAG: hypothetical protein H6737_01980 [Alphaproteobacteria bacterium]|nr:hypothetical protein [Alphaproteobacteria bacterium]